MRHSDRFPCSEALARHLQDEENARLHDHYARRDLERMERARAEQENEQERRERGRRDERRRALDNVMRPKKKSDCIIM